MEKITVKPSTKEILIKGAAPDGHSDLFSYNYWGNSENNLVAPNEPSNELGKKLGGLFIVGHVKPENEDTAYIISLVASLAKREYYSKPNIGPKDAFSSALKKINEVLEDFFKNKEAKINIGIFVVAGENIFISKLGKFKIILARDGKNIDVLNNINLFDKEHIQEQEFSNVISGKIFVGDKIFAFYPNRSLTAKEEYIKTHLVKTGPDEFVKKLDLIKTDKNNFECAAIHIIINKYKEPPIVTRPQPPELKNPRPTSEDAPVILAKSDYYKPPVLDEKSMPSKIEPDKKDGQDNIPLKMTAKKEEKQSKIEESPLLIPSEFSSNKKDNIFSILMKKLRPVSIRGIDTGSSMFKKVVLPIIVTVLAAGSYFFIKPILVATSQDRSLKPILTEAETSLKSAQEQSGQNNLFEARDILGNILVKVNSVTDVESTKLDAIKGEITTALDEIDLANEVTARLESEVPESLISQISAIKLIADNISAGKYKNDSPIITSGIYEDNLYLLTNETILKVLDATKGSLTATKWLSDGISLPANNALMAVDGKMYVLNKSGLLTVYYKGTKLSDTNTLIPVSNNDILIAPKDSEYLYLINKSLGRIYLITKASGSLTKTLRLSQPLAISNAIIYDNSLYLILSDNNIWKVGL